MRARHLCFTALALTALVATAASAQDDKKDDKKEDKLEDRAKSAAHVLANLVSDPKNAPPNKLLRSAVCMAIIPSVKSAAVVVGGQAGYGLASCRVGNSWSLPTYISLKAGSVGFQIGGSATDVALIFTHDDAPQLIAGNNFQIGGQASVAAGPVGSTIGANTDFKKGSSIYSYSTKGAGLFAGVSWRAATCTWTPRATVAPIPRASYRWIPTSRPRSRTCSRRRPAPPRRPW